MEHKSTTAPDLTGIYKIATTLLACDFLLIMRSRP